MVKGLRSPTRMQLDLLKTYGASRGQVFWKLRLPASLPYFFASLKVAIAASLIGAIVGELPTGAINGLGARMLIGSQFGQPLIMWAALFAAAILAGILILSSARSSAPPTGAWGWRDDLVALAIAIWLLAWWANVRLAESGGARPRATPCRRSSV